MRGTCDACFRGGGALSFHVFPAGCQDAGKPVKFPQLGTFRTKQRPDAAAPRSQQARAVPSAKAMKPETQSSVYIGVGTNSIVIRQQ
jgi:hypothetical protein